MGKGCLKTRTAANVNDWQPYDPFDTVQRLTISEKYYICGIAALEALSYLCTVKTRLKVENNDNNSFLFCFFFTQEHFFPVGTNVLLTAHLFINPQLQIRFNYIS
jgi:hypothetical protein